MKKIFNILLVVLVFASIVNAATLPDTGCDVPGTVTAAINKLAMWVGYAVGGYFAFLLVYRPLRYARMALGKGPNDKFSEEWGKTEEWKKYCRDNRV